ncbi:MAG: hypothetical protein U0Z26_11605 [Anaerolineales bacterium]
MKYLAVIFTIFVAVIIVLADKGILPHFISMLYDFPNGDKVGHFFLFGLLNFLLTYTFIQTFPRFKPWQVTLSIGLILAVLIGLEELSQKNYATRTFDLVDLLATYLGLLAGGWIAFKIKNRSH